MPLIYITGNSGAGKSTIRKELQKRGYEAHDTDENGITCWYNKQTGKKVEKPPELKDRTQEWYTKHDWRVSRKRIEELVSRAKDRSVFLCGTTANENKVWDLFSTVIFLTIDIETLKHRLATRTNNEFGKTSVELRNILSQHKLSEEINRKFGAIMIDATQSVPKVVDKLLDYAERRQD
ncbi:MAG: AAA family ATPase [bacterium]|nr:AAA family ATPase [bacterium]